MFSSNRKVFMKTIEQLHKDLRTIKIAIIAIFGICLLYLTIHQDEGTWNMICFLSLFGFIGYHFVTGYFETKRAIKFYQRKIDEYERNNNANNF